MDTSFDKFLAYISYNKFLAYIIVHKYLAQQLNALYNDKTEEHYICLSSPSGSTCKIWLLLWY